jgi:tetratricopeptide (TPR) repeat protein
MMSDKQRKLCFMLIIAFFILSAGVGEALWPGHEEYLKTARSVNQVDIRDPEGNRSVFRSTSFQTLLPALLGVREVLASLMWVRADDYFHRGEYRPIIQMVKQITMIDPHQIDVYATGAWHMAYNFMDKRLIPDGVMFLEDGCKNNDAVYDLYFELGYMHYDKTKLYPKAEQAYRTSASRGTTIPGRTKPPAYVRHQLAHAMEKMGDIDRSLEQWKENVRIGSELEEGGELTYAAAGPNTSAARNNLYINERRRNERVASLYEREKNTSEAIRLWQANVELADRWLQRQPGHSDVLKDRGVALGNVARLKAGRLASVEPFEVVLQPKIVRLAPRKLEISGDLNVLDLSRIHVRIADKDYDQRSKNFDFKMKYCTLEYENVSVKQGKFKRVFDLDKDPADMGRDAEEIYPLAADEFVVTFEYNPRTQAVFIQDRYGWSGEGLTGKQGELKIDEEKSGTLFGKKYPLRTVVQEVVLTKAEITGGGKKQIYPRVP